jgi:molecular chaperone GrpE
MIDRQELADRLLDYLQTVPELPEYLAESPESLPSFDPDQMVGEWIALRQEVKQQNKLMQSAHLALQQALEVEQSRTKELQIQLQNIVATAKRNDDGGLLKDLLSVMDDLDRTISHHQSQITATQPPQLQKSRFLQKLFFREPEPTLAESLTSALTSNLKGIEMIRRSLLAILRQRQITPIVALEQPFDSQCMYAIAQQHSDSVPANCVIQEVVRGYRQGDRILREAQVIVASKPNDLG